MNFDDTFRYNSLLITCRKWVIGKPFDFLPTVKKIGTIKIFTFNWVGYS